MNTGDTKASASQLDPAEQGDLLLQSLEKIRQNFDDIVVIKYGGAGMSEGVLSEPLLDLCQLRRLGMCPVLVHGGGPRINAELKLRNISPQFIDGLRVTDAQTLAVTEMVLSGQVNQELVAMLSTQPDIRAVGVSGKSGGLLQAEQTHLREYGLVGEVQAVNPEVLQVLIDNDFIPVVSPLALDEKGQTLNVNADKAATSIATALQASFLVFLTDVEGVLDAAGQRIEQLSLVQAHEIMQEGSISGGMIPKMEAVCHALEQGVQNVVITAAHASHSLIRSVFGNHSCGTLISST